MKAVVFLGLMIPLVLAAQEEPPAGVPPRPCDAPQYRQFDFWIGDWDVTADGQPAGTNSVHSIHGGCAIQENWQGTGPGGISGTSFNIYDSSTGRWHQTWVDASGLLLQLDGGWMNGSMVLSGSRSTLTAGQVIDRITFTPNEDGSVRQLWEASRDDGATWTTVFDGLYVKAAGRQ